MSALLQRVTSASVSSEGKLLGEIGPGLLVLLGITHDDDEEKAARLVAKTVKLRIFGDEQGKMNRSLLDVDGSLLVISQFTLFANRSEEHTSELQSRGQLVCRLLLDKK